VTEEIQQTQETTATAEAPAASIPPDAVFHGLGRRKTSIARVRLARGNGKVTINGVDYEDYCTDIRQVQAIRAPLRELKLANRFDVTVRATGGGRNGQAGAIVLGIARALVKADPSTEEKLRDLGMLTRDPRMRERKKYGKKGARASFQFSKR